MTSQPSISIISPVFGAQGIVAELVKRISESASKVTDNFEILLIEDHSPDNSWNEIVLQANTNKKVKGVKLSRNFGQHNAIAAGMELAKGDFVILLDCDLQQDPKYIPEMFNKIKEGYDLVYTRTISREHSFLKNITAKMYYSILKFISDFNMDPNIGSYSLLSRKVVNAYNQYSDYKKAYLWALKWAGFNAAILDIEHNSRHSGKSSYTFLKLLKLALNVAIANSNKMLYLSVYLGLGTSLLAFLGGMVVIYQYLTTGALVGWSSLTVLITFFSGLILSTIGISSIYLANIFDQAKGRPRYIVSEKLNFDDK